jgi:3-hydroxyacyl-CoA dehydrogenase/enoyl-CoA hydratase/3-hydroxybutyryl-CoA epimerase
LAEERLGRKTGRGFYAYGEKKKRVDPDVYRFFPDRPSTRPSATVESLGERLTLIFAMEAVRCLEEEIIASPADGDVGAVFGFGYPPMRGGPFRHLDTLGLDAVVARMGTLAERHGPAYEVPELLRRMARDQETFATRRDESEADADEEKEQA